MPRKPPPASWRWRRVGSRQTYSYQVWNCYSCLFMQQLVNDHLSAHFKWAGLIGLNRYWMCSSDARTSAQDSWSFDHREALHILVYCTSRFAGMDSRNAPDPVRTVLMWTRWTSPCQLPVSCCGSRRSDWGGGRSKVPVCFPADALRAAAHHARLWLLRGAAKAPPLTNSAP